MDLRVRRRDQGLSLLETIIAFGVLVAGFAVFFRLYHSALTYSSAGERKTLAATIAQRQLAKLRAWSTQPAVTGRNFDTWTTTGTDVSVQDLDHPEYTIRTRTEFVDAVSPNVSLITGPSGFAKKTMEATFRKVQINVSWSQGDLELVSLIADPTRQLRAVNPVVITGPSGAIAKDTPTTMTVQAFDTDDRVIPDLMARWYVKPINGVGQIDPTSPIEGGSATFVNASEKMDGSIYHTGGICRVTARVVYRGQEAWGESGDLDLGAADPLP